MKPFTLTIQISDLPEDEKRRRLWEALDLLCQDDEQHAAEPPAESKEKATTSPVRSPEKKV